MIFKEFTPGKRLAAAIVFLAFLFCTGVAQAAEWVDSFDGQIESLRQGTTKEDRIKLAILLHVKSKYAKSREPLYAEIRDILDGFQNPSGPVKPEDPAHLWDKSPEDYDPQKVEEVKLALYSGKDEEIVDFFWSDPPKYAMPTLDCRWLEKSPGLFGLHHIVMGGSRVAAPLAQITCDRKPEIPASIWALRKKLGQQFGYPPRAASERFRESELLYVPQKFLTQTPDLSDAMKEASENFRSAPFLENWSLYSLWNFHTAKQYASEFEQAKHDLAKYYSGLPLFKGVPRKTVDIAARNMLKNYFAAYDYKSFVFPPQPKGIRWHILHGIAPSEITKRFDKCPGATRNNEDVVKDNTHTDFAIGMPEPLTFLAVDRPDVIVALLECGSQVTDENEAGKTLLMNAAHFDALEGAKLALARMPAEKRTGFLNAQSDPPYTSQDTGVIPPQNIKHGNRTALMYAAENASAKFIDWLLAEGAEPCIKDSKGLTALDYMEGGNPAAFTNPHLKKAERKRLSPKLACPSLP